MTEHETTGSEPAATTDAYVQQAARALVIIATWACGLGTSAAGVAAILIRGESGAFPALGWLPLAAGAGATLALLVGQAGIPDPRTRRSAMMDWISEKP